MEVAFKVLDIPKAVSKSVSVPQLEDPSLSVVVISLLPPEVAFPVESMIPF